MKKIFILTLSAIFTSTLVFGQGDLDAFRYSQNGLYGSARGVGMGGAFGALGGDITGVKSNPGGIAIYHSSEVTGTLDFNSITDKSTIGSYSDSQDKFKANLGNLSYIGYFPLEGETFKSFNVGLSYNKVMDFDRTYNSAASGVTNSLLDYVCSITNGIDESYMKTNGGASDPYENVNWLSVLSYQSYLLNTTNNSTNQYASVVPDQATVSPDLSVHERGYIDSYDFSIGTDVSDILYLGLTMSFTDLDYKLNSLYNESFSGSNFGLGNYLHTTGSGYQFTLGAIFNPAREFRIGVAYHSPVWYDMTDSYYADMSYSGISNIVSTPYGKTDYTLRTPSKWVFSAAGILSDKAVVDVDYELSDFKEMNLGSNDDYYSSDYSSQNSAIDNHFRLSQTVKAGLEYKFLPQFSMRIGYAFAQSPYADKVRDGGSEMMVAGTVPNYTVEGDTHYYTYGLGYRFDKHFYADAAFVFSKQNISAFYFPTVFNSNGSVNIGSPETKLENKSVRGLLTLGYRF